MLALHGVGVLVTRPEGQATPLCRLLEELGATALRLPAIVIRPGCDPGELHKRLAPLERFDIILFTSANAVRYGASLAARNGKVAVGAIGTATAGALTRAGLRVTISPIGGSDSESLLAHPLLAHPAGCHVLIVKGQYGREHLQEELTRRGALVAVAEVYRRERATHDVAQLSELEAAFAAGRIQIITATSAQIAATLLDAATPALRREFEQVPWLVPGARVASALRAGGVIAPILLAATAEDQDFLAAIVRWRSSVSTA